MTNRDVIIACDFSSAEETFQVSSICLRTRPANLS